MNFSEMTINHVTNSNHFNTINSYQHQNMKIKSQGLEDEGKLIFKRTFTA